MNAAVFFPLILDIKFVRRTSRGHTGGRSHRTFHPPFFCGACLNFSREKEVVGYVEFDRNGTFDEKTRVLPTGILK